MIKMEMKSGRIELEMHGSDDLILSELSLAVTRMLTALEQCDGRPLAENLGYLILSLIAQKDELCSAESFRK